MKSELAEEIFELIEARSQNRPTPMDFEMAYQARIAIDRIRFAIKHSEQFAPNMDQIRNVGLQLLDALHRLEAVDRRFQKRSRVPMESLSDERHPGRDSLAVDGSRSLDQLNGERRR
jgi:hypothetical protein